MEQHQHELEVFLGQITMGDGTLRDKTGFPIEKEIPSPFGPQDHRTVIYCYGMISIRCKTCGKRWAGLQEFEAFEQEER